MKERNLETKADLTQKTQAKQYADQLAAVAHSAELSKEVDSKFTYKVVRRKEIGRCITFTDGSYLIIKSEGILVLPADDKSVGSF